MKSLVLIVSLYEDLDVSVAKESTASELTRPEIPPFSIYLCIYLFCNIPAGSTAKYQSHHPLQAICALHKLLTWCCHAATEVHFIPIWPVDIIKPESFNLFFYFFFIILSFWLQFNGVM